MLEGELHESGVVQLAGAMGEAPCEPGRVLGGVEEGVEGARAEGAASDSGLEPGVILGAGECEDGGARVARPAGREGGGAQPLDGERVEADEECP